MNAPGPWSRWARRWHCSTRRPSVASAPGRRCRSASAARSPTSRSGWPGSAWTCTLDQPGRRRRAGHVRHPGDPRRGRPGARVRGIRTRPTGLMLKEHRDGRPWRVRYYRSGSAASRLSPADVDEPAAATAISRRRRAAPDRHHRRARPGSACRRRAGRSRSPGPPALSCPSTSTTARRCGPTRRPHRCWPGSPPRRTWSSPDRRRPRWCSAGIGPTGPVTFDDGETLARELAKLGPATVVVKLGALGALAAARRRGPPGAHPAGHRRRPGRRRRRLRRRLPQRARRRRQPCPTACAWATPSGRPSAVSAATGRACPPGTSWASGLAPRTSSDDGDQDSDDSGTRTAMTDPSLLNRCPRRAGGRARPPRPGPPARGGPARRRDRRRRDHPAHRRRPRVDPPPGRRCPTCTSGPGRSWSPTRSTRSSTPAPGSSSVPGLSVEVVQRCRSAGGAGAARGRHRERSDDRRPRSASTRSSSSRPACSADRPRSAPSPHPFTRMSFMPSGGVNADNMADYLAIPAVPAVSGSWMVDPALLRAGRWDEVTARSADAMARAT